jgi:hypothetical protein
MTTAGLSRVLALCFSPLLDPPFSPPLPFSSISFFSTSYSIALSPFLLFSGRGRRAEEGARGGRQAGRGLATAGRGGRAGRGTTGNRSFTESKNLWREPSLGLSAKNSSLRVKTKTLGEDKNSR